MSRSVNRLTTSTPKPSSPRKMLPTPATRTRLRLTKVLQVQRFDLLGREEEPVPEDTVPTQVPARIVLQRDRDIDPVLVVLFYTLDDRDLLLERDVHDVATRAGPEQDPASLLDLDAAYVHALKRGPLLQLSKEIPPLLPQHPELSDGSVQVHELLLGKSLGPLQNLARPRVRGTLLFFLLLREGENVQNEQLVDLAPVEQVAGALRGDLGVVVEDDR